MIDKTFIDTALVKKLVAAQFPQWKHLPVRQVNFNGWDNRTFHLGDQMLVRMPSAEEYAAQVEKEQVWLPQLAPHLPLQIPAPLAEGVPSEGYPWKWSIYRWLEGESAATTYIADLNEFALSLAQFLAIFQSLDTNGGPLPGPHNFYRGGELKVYDEETRDAIASLHGKIDSEAVLKIWERALTSTWKGAPVWVHGDISVGNLLLQEGHLSAVIDFGQLAIGDPACDLSIAWTLFRGRSREVFRAAVSLDPDTWARARAWTLWKSVTVAAGFTNPHNTESALCWRIIDEVLEDID